MPQDLSETDRRLLENDVLYKILEFQDNFSLPSDRSPSVQPQEQEEYRFRVPEEAWRETKPSKEIILSTRMQYFNFCNPPSIQTRGEALPSNMFGNPMSADVQPTPQPLLPPRLFDLLLNRTGDTVGLDGETYGVDWQVPVSSAEKLTLMMEFARIVGGVRYVWIDILCLNQAQSNEEEIACMESYYANASVCLVWLDQAPNQEKAEWAEVLNALKTVNNLTKHDEYGHPTCTYQEILDDGFCNVSFDGGQAFDLVRKLAALEKAPWFKRV
ncbi:MAG: hypothetical protein Q9214_000667 [Letrouitia sp. 1 TL-2023]